MKHKAMLLFILMLLGATYGLFAQTYCLDFDGNDNVAMGNLGFVGTTYTVECWINASSLPAMTSPDLPYCRTILASSQIAGNYPVWFGTTGNNIKVWSYSTNQDTGGHATTGLGLTTNTWYHIAVITTKGGTTKLYVNGVEKLSFTNLGQGADWNTAFTVGDLRPGRLLGFYGKILDVRVWNVIRTQAEIQYGMNNDLTGTEQGLVGYWPLHEGSGTTAFDHVVQTPHNGALGTVASGWDPAWATGMPYVDLTSFSPAVDPSTVMQSDVKVPLTRFTLTAQLAASALNQLSFNTSGTYLATDIVNLKLWSSASDDISGATLLGTLTSGLGAGLHTFTGLTQTLLQSTTRYFWITADISATAVGGNTINATPIMTSDMTVTSRFKTGSSSAGGDKTFYDITLPVELSSFTAVPTAEYFIELHWVTQSETNISGFYIYRSNVPNISTSVAITNLMEGTNTASESNYTYVDNDVLPGTWYYWLGVAELDGQINYNGPVMVVLTANPDDPGIPVVPEVYGIKQIFPNPFNPSATILCNIKETGSVSLDIFNIKGEHVRNLASGQHALGNLITTWDGRSESGALCSSGIYFVRLIAGNQVQTRKVMMLK